MGEDAGLPDRHLATTLPLPAPWDDQSKLVASDPDNL